MIREPQDLNDAALRDRAVDAALGRAPFDLLLVGGQLVNVATSEIYAADIGIIGGLIASVHAPGLRGDATEVVDLAGQFIAPGLIDTHMHIESSMVTPRRYAQTVVPQGTTTVVWDPHEVGNVAGLAGVDWAIAAARGLDLRVLTLAPSCVPSAPGIERAGATFDPPEMQQMLANPDIYGVAEVMDMRGVLTRASKMRGIVDAGLASGKLVCGHGRGLVDAELQGFVAAGISSDHEITGAVDFLQKIRAGLTIELRGSHDYVLPDVIAVLKTLPHLPQTLTICTDDVFPDDLAEKGGMNDVLRRLVGYGMAPVDALRAATLNAAMRLGRADLGAIAPGRRADIAVFRDLSDFRASVVLASGRIVARDGVALRAEHPAAALPFADTVKLAPLTADDFEIRAAGDQVQVNTVVKPRFTAWGEATLQVEEGIVQVPADLLRMAVVHRHGLADPTPMVGLLQEWGSWTGAIATTIAHDSHNLNVFGADPVDMAAAANALIACGGGMAVAKGGKVIGLLPLPVCGLLSDTETADVGAALAALRDAADQVADWLPPLRTFKALVGASLACNPGPHVTDMGICDGTTGDIRKTVR
ncbi:adenine deaminase [Ketogulonicigenium vulgare]|uniref:Adenine deaminase n=1 Tax=Ketogulonicigenium vulgare (strain WSH-001) TaxID=759362 RepID=F9Y6G7_KETVW|nr:adenine deaminase C-terminal domain-containing protein [Ketogulonicigenium vulgare]ADO42720.1 Adenine deaminase [Ketogulonicigenium vulgare Y25]AEM40913.1 Adenine deaminase 2 [Ketogulonicigenium vulgare WSH-001]ALJ81065.1 adenosine deaminase [Ketogulonicigenium vulgare]ANW33819.1 adenosine deaminase [Ketogulonicigenium vulgare]AOZ54632.1 Adenine deaminase [Ketogulonicigenium vulgare]